MEASGIEGRGSGRAGVVVEIEADGALAVVTLDQPERRNAQTPAMWRELARIGRELPGSVRVVVLRAEGRSFSAGLDRRMFEPAGVPGEHTFAELAAMKDTEIERTLSGYQEAFTWWRRPDLVTVAAVQGHAVGAGFQLALACDVRVCAENAQFAMRETSLGLVPDLCGTKPLRDAVGPARALEICLTGRWVDAAEAERIGLAAIVVPRGELDDAAREFGAAVLAAPRNAAIETKALLSGAGERSYPEQCAAERGAQTRRLRDLAGLGE